MSHTIETRTLSRSAAHVMVEAAQNAAAREGIAIAVTCVDAGGHVIVTDRMDGAATCAVPLAQSKAETAAATMSPTAAWFQSTQPGQPDWGMNVPLGGKFNAMPGGLPIEIDGTLVGAVGVSGGEAHQDEACANAAIAALGGK
ncbi:heme-binding protein [Mameliella alba]|uniref:GlcG/HbpS family heme-binding protein n=1 Tax=Mameliella alba TaxID=561184 RepID=UPI001C979AD5|nr:heme-binding protein [Mameliella alba]MBY6120395.1 heme-binding protein [Mameliella alba]